MESKQRSGTVPDSEWAETVRYLVRRDYFPFAAAKHDGANADLSLPNTDGDRKRIKLDDYLAEHVSERHASFSNILQRDCDARLAMFSDKKSFLRQIEPASSTKQLNDKNEASEISGSVQERKVDPNGTRFPPPPSSQAQFHQRRSMLRPEDRPRVRDFDLVSMASRTTTTSTKTWHSGIPGQKPLSERGLALLEKMRNERKRPHTIS